MADFDDVPGDRKSEAANRSWARRGCLYGFGLLAIVVIVLISIPTDYTGYRRYVYPQDKARSFLKAVSAGQAMFKDQLCVDQNHDGIGEYGFLSELAGVKQPNRCNFEFQPFVPAEMGKINILGSAVAIRYCYKIYLPDADGGALEERTGFVPPADPKNAERQAASYVMYAWPELREPRLPVFAIDPQGQVFVLKEHDFFGIENPPPWNLLYHGGWDAPIDEKRWAPAD